MRMFLSLLAKKVICFCQNKNVASVCSLINRKSCIFSVSQPTDVAPTAHPPLPAMAWPSRNAADRQMAQGYEPSQLAKMASHLMGI
jgi:hypothetical protein